MAAQNRAHIWSVVLHRILQFLTCLDWPCATSSLVACYPRHAMLRRVPMRGTTREHESERLQACIDNCSNCHAACVETLVYCLQKGGHAAAEGHVRRRRDGAERC